MGKMGSNMSLRLAENGWQVSVHDRDPERATNVATHHDNLSAAATISELVEALEAPRVIWVMVPHSAVQKVLHELAEVMSEGDVIIDGGNTHFKDTKRHHAFLDSHNISLVDAGVSGGPAGARNGACLMVGGESAVVQTVESLFKAVAQPRGYRHVGGPAAGHFVKMVHNGIEYGMMQAIAEGFSVLKEGEFDLSLTDVADVYSHGSVIESRLISWLKDGLEAEGESLANVTSRVSHSGEGKWTIETAQELGVQVPVIEESFNFRLASDEHETFTGRVLSLLRHQFGGHNMREE